MSKSDEFNHQFPTTRWSLIMMVKSDTEELRQKALDELCRIYWLPLYAFARKKGNSSHDAEDLTQEFLSDFLSKEYFNGREPSSGKMRSYLLKAFTNFMTNEWRRSNRIKRGSGKAPISIDQIEAEHRFANLPSDNVTPEHLYDKAWALALLDSVLDNLESNFESEKKKSLFLEIRPFLTGDSNECAYQEIADRMGMKVGAVKTAVHRMRHQYRDALRAAVSDTLTEKADIDAEIRALFEILRG